MEKLQRKTGEVSLKVIKVRTESDLEIAQSIRYEVFVVGQQVPAEEEIDSFESQSHHFLAFYNSVPVGAARWRFTSNGIKLERFAVLEKYRGLGIGSALVEAVLQDIGKHSEASGKLMYLHSQLSAMRLYSNFGFKKVGEIFQECEIDHYKMIR